MHSDLSLALLCGRAYQEMSYSVHEIEASLSLLPEGPVVAFRGTEANSKERNILDILRDVRFIPWQDEETQTFSHAGFKRGALAFLKRHEDDLLDDLTLTGHSLGAAVAVHVAMLVPEKVRRVVLFGEPRGFYKNASGYYKTLCIPTISYRNGNDIVCTLPPWGKHSVPQTKIGKASKLWPNFNDHGIEKYIQSMRALQHARDG